MKIKVVRVASSKKPEVVEIDDSLGSLQHEVDGYIEVCYPFDDYACIIVNEEGKLGGYEPNRAILDGNEIVDIIFGTFLVVGMNDDEDTFVSLTDEQVKTYTKMYEKPEMFVRFGNKISRVFM